jgi:hypothetical protein
MPTQPEWLALMQLERVGSFLSVRNVRITTTSVWFLPGKRCRR